MSDIQNTPEKTPPSGIFKVVATKKDSEIERLSAQLTQERDERKEERFGWIVALVAAIDVPLLGSMDSTLAPAAVFVLQLIALLVLARKSGVEYVELILSRLIGSLGPRIEK